MSKETSSGPVDLRSDTVTRPTAGMRQAMANAEVGDDWYGEDPSVNRLQEEVAALLGKPAGLWVSSGTLGNQVALRVHCRHGDDVLVGEESHNQWHENGGAAALAGVQFSVIGNRGAAAAPATDQVGLFTPAQVSEAVKPANGLYPPTRLLSIENTHNRGGGRVWPLAQLQAVCAAGRQAGLALHLDGARLWNAAVASGIAEATLAAPFDTVSVCLSKGLGAPAGSVLCGAVEAIARARRYRQMYGGGLRQAGVLAAAGRYALHHHRARLGEDHGNAQQLGARLSEIPGILVRTPIETNIIVFDLAGPGEPGGAAADAAALVAALRARGVLLNAFGRRRLRAVTHLDVSAADCARAAEHIAAAWAALRAEGRGA